MKNTIGLVRTVEGVKGKRCSGCKTWKPLTEFTLGSGPGGYHRHCRGCCKAYRARKAQQPVRATA